MSGSTCQNLDSRRIVVNTVCLYVRLVVTTLANLVAVRVLVRTLGNVGFGVWSAVGGVGVIVFFLRWSMQVVVQRFLSIEIARGDEGRLRDVFSAGCGFALVTAAVLLLAGETIGLWFVAEKLLLPPGTRTAALAAYQFCLLAFVVDTVRLPYESLIVAGEKMGFFARVSLVEAVLALGAACAAALLRERQLEAYACLLAGQEVVVLLLFVVSCRRRFRDIRFFGRIDGRLFGDQVAFFFKCVPSDVVNMLKSQGVNLLLNLYAGPLFNATWNLSSKVNANLYGFVANFQQAYFPQIVKLWQQENKRPFYRLLSGSFRWSFVVMGACVLPLLVFTRPVLEFWIGGDLPPQAVAFTRCVLVHVLCDSLVGPLHMAILATARVGRYQVGVSAVMGSGFLLAWACLSAGLPPWTSVGAVALTNLLALAYRLSYMHRKMGLAVGPFFRRSFFPWMRRVK